MHEPVMRRPWLRRSKPNDLVVEVRLRCDAHWSREDLRRRGFDHDSVALQLGAQAGERLRATADI
jgi:hypothetical protein